MWSCAAAVPEPTWKPEVVNLALNVELLLIAISLAAVRKMPDVALSLAKPIDGAPTEPSGKARNNVP